MPKKYMKTKSKLSFFKSKRTLYAFIAILLVVTGLWALDRNNTLNFPFVGDDESQSTDDTSADGINYGPPTDEEKAAADVIKESQGSAASSAPPVDTPSGKKTVNPIISSWGQSSQDVEVSGFVPGIIESGGTCTLTLKKSSQSVTQNKSATPDAQTTSCGFITVSRSRLSPGSWSATITYSSSTSGGTSQPQTVEVE